MARPRPSFANCVFLNVPFDDAYKPIFQAIVFAVYDCGFLPRCALEESDSGDVRFEKLIRLMKKCRYSIHDISRTQLDAETKLPRFNMPFEFGFDLGLRRSGLPQWKKKRCLVLDNERYRYQTFLSDIAGQDIREHGNNPRKAIMQVRDWLRAMAATSGIPGGAKVYEHYQGFWIDLPRAATQAQLGLAEMTYLDYTALIEGWLTVRVPPGTLL